MDQHLQSKPKPIFVELDEDEQTKKLILQEIHLQYQQNQETKISDFYRMPDDNEPITISVNHDLNFLDRNLQEFKIQQLLHNIIDNMCGKIPQSIINSRHSTVRFRIFGSGHIITCDKQRLLEAAAEMKQMSCPASMEAKPKTTACIKPPIMPRQCQLVCGGGTNLNFKAPQKFQLDLRNKESIHLLEDKLRSTSRRIQKITLAPGITIEREVKMKKKKKVSGNDGNKVEVAELTLSAEGDAAAQATKAEVPEAEPPLPKETCNKLSTRKPPPIQVAHGMTDKRAMKMLDFGNGAYTKFLSQEKLRWKKYDKIMSSIDSPREMSSRKIHTPSSSCKLDNVVNLQKLVQHQQKQKKPVSSLIELSAGWAKEKPKLEPIQLPLSCLRKIKPSHQNQEPKNQLKHMKKNVSTDLDLTLHGKRINLCRSKSKIKIKK